MGVFTWRWVMQVLLINGVVIFTSRRENEYDSLLAVGRSELLATLSQWSFVPYKFHNGEKASGPLFQHRFVDNNITLRVMGDTETDMLNNIELYSVLNGLDVTRRKLTYLGPIGYKERFSGFSPFNLSLAFAVDKCKICGRCVIDSSSLSSGICSVCVRHCEHSYKIEREEVFSGKYDVVRTVKCWLDNKECKYCFDQCHQRHAVEEMIPIQKVSETRHCFRCHRTDIEVSRIEQGNKKLLSIPYGEPLSTTVQIRLIEKVRQAL